MTEHPPRSPMPLPGPLDTDPTSVIAHLAQVAGTPGDNPTLTLTCAMLDAAVDGLQLGEYDQEIVAWVKQWGGTAITGTIASLLRRAHAAGVAAGRAETVEESPTVQHLSAALERTTRGLDQATARLDAVHADLTDLVTAAASPSATTAQLQAAITGAVARARRP